MEKKKHKNPDWDARSQGLNTCGFCGHSFEKIELVGGFCKDCLKKRPFPI